MSMQRAIASRSSSVSSKVMPEVYRTVIERGNSPLADWCIDFLKPRITPPYLDIGCNCGWLLSEVDGGMGVDQSEPLILAARAKGLSVLLAPAHAIPLPTKYFATCVLCNVLEQCYDPDAVFCEAVRLGSRVIGLSPIPGGPWGVAGVGWVRSVLSRQWFEERGCAVEEHKDRGKLAFQWNGA
jgi:hypothetical protein